MSFVLLGILNSQAAGGGAPAFLSSAPLWLDASDASTITESGGSVSQWDNKGTLENFSQGTAADQPTTGVNTLNGLNVIDFADDFLEGATKAQWKFMHDGTQYFYAAVVKFTSNSSALMGNQAFSGDNIGLHITTNASGSWQNYVSGGGGTFSIGVSDSGFAGGGSYNVMSAVLDPDNATAADRIDYYENNTEGSVANTFTDTPSSSDPTFNLHIGSNANPSFDMNGSIAELIVVSGADATETNRQAVVDYLNTKWSVF